VETPAAAVWSEAVAVMMVGRVAKMEVVPAACRVTKMTVGLMAGDLPREAVKVRTRAEVTTETVRGGTTVEMTAVVTMAVVETAVPRVAGVRAVMGKGAEEMVVGGWEVAVMVVEAREVATAEGARAAAKMGVEVRAEVAAVVTTVAEMKGEVVRSVVAKVVVVTAVPRVAVRTVVVAMVVGVQVVAVMVLEVLVVEATAVVAKETKGVE